MSLVSNNLQKVVDLPMWEFVRSLPAATTSTSAFTIIRDPADYRYIYYVNSTTVYRYDTVTDAWQTLAYPFSTTPSTLIALKSTNQCGYRGIVLSATSNTFTANGIDGVGAFKNRKVRIISGKGMGQERTIISITEPKVFDYGIATVTTNARQIQDTTKKWKINQWYGYTVAIRQGSGATQYRKIVCNDTSILRVDDDGGGSSGLFDPFNSATFGATYGTPSSAAGSQTQYQIESSTYTIDSNWTTVPDETSRFIIYTPGLWMWSSYTAAQPFNLLQYFDLVADQYVNKTSTGGFFTAAVGTRLVMEEITDQSGVYVTGSINSSTNRIIRYDSNATSSLDRWVNYRVRITSGSGVGQYHRIIANTTSSLEIDGVWDPPVATGSKFEIINDAGTLIMGGNLQSAFYKYDVEADIMYQGPLYDYGILRNMSIQKSGSIAIPVSSATRNTNGITGVNGTPTAKGTGYSVGDVLTITTGGTNGKVYVETISIGGLVESVSLFAAGSGYTTGTGKATSGGTGTGCTIEITTVGTVGRIALSPHIFKIGDKINFRGASEAAWNTAYTIIGSDSISGIDIPITAIATATAANSTSTTVLVDSSKNWITNEHVGKIVNATNGSGLTTVNQFRRITANTATTLTLQSAVTGVTAATNKYVIHDIYSFGRAVLYGSPDKTNTGYATSGSNNILVDTTKNWNLNQWSGSRFRIIAGNGRDREITITSNSSSSLSFAIQTFSVNNTTKYIVMDSFGLCTTGTTTSLTDSTKRWTTNVWTGKRVRITSGTAMGNEYLITSNTSNTLTFATATAPSTDSTYTILDMSTRAGGDPIHNWNVSNFNDRGKYLYFPRGNSTFNQTEIYDLTKDVLVLGRFVYPIFPLFNTDSVWTYDGRNRIYGITWYLDLTNNNIYPWTSIPLGGSTVSSTLSKKYEIVTTPDGLKYLYYPSSGGTLFWKSLLYN